MRIYIPATSADVTTNPISDRLVHAVTPALEREMPSEEAEMLEAVAMNAAADESVARIGAALGSGGDVVPRRCVIAAEVPQALLAKAEGEDLLPTAMKLLEPLGWRYVDSLHIDDVDVEELVFRAAQGDDVAFDELVDEDLMWYDVAELPFLEAALQGK